MEHRKTRHHHFLETQSLFFDPQEISLSIRPPQAFDTRHLTSQLELIHHRLVFLLIHEKKILVLLFFSS